MMLVEGESYSPSFSSVAPQSAAKSKGVMKSKKRFRDDQIKSLESIFENESKLEPRKKIQLANELGLHPRQIAIWFQNKRARSKSKQLERDYNILMDNYNSLATRFQNLREERQSLILQLQKLNDLVDKTQVETRHHQGGSNIIGTQTHFKNQESDSNCNIINYNECESEDKQGFPLDQSSNSFVMDEDWHTLHSDGLFDESMSSCEWLDLWSPEEPLK